jgi:hypothetical protein
MTFRNMDDLLSKEEHIKNYIRSFIALEEAIEPFKEQKRDLREEYDENDWLSKEEMRLAVRAYRIMQKGTDLEELIDYIEKVSTVTKGP